MASGPLTSCQREGGKVEAVTLYFLGLQNHCIWWLQPQNLKMVAPWKKSYDKTRQCVKKQRCHFANEGSYSQSFGFSQYHIPVWELDHKEAWELKYWHFWIVMLEKTLASSLHSKGIKPVNPKGNQSWIFIGRTDAENEAVMLCPPVRKSQLIEKDRDAGEDWKQKKRAAEDEMVREHHCQCTWIEQTPGDSEWQGRLVCCV